MTTPLEARAERERREEVEREYARQDELIRRRTAIAQSRIGKIDGLAEDRPAPKSSEHAESRA